MKYLTLTRKGEADPTPFETVDAELCELLHMPVHDTAWCFAWFPTVAPRLLEGETFAHVRAVIANGRPLGDPDNADDRILDELYRDAMNLMLRYLEEHFVVNDPAFLRRT